MKRIFITFCIVSTIFVAKAQDDAGTTTSETSTPEEVAAPTGDAITSIGTTGTTSAGNTEILSLPWVQEVTGQRLALAYENIREADVFWSKIVYRVIDTREKMNLPFMWPKKPFINVVLDAVAAGDAVAFASNDDEFTTPLKPDEAAAAGGAGGYDSVDVYNPITEAYEKSIIKREVNWENVKKFRVKEVWYFNKQTSTMMCRIMAIAPVLDSYDEYGTYRGQQALFWAYFPSLRPTLVKTQAFNPFPDGMKMSWDDLFALRLFSSYIYKEENVLDERVQDRWTGIDALYESERIKEGIFNFEHDLWEY
jgi:gliding motility associated protien GldN